MSGHKPGLFRLVLHALGGERKRPRNTSSVTRTYYVTGHLPLRLALIVPRGEWRRQP
jgi:hypothetical protein